MGKALLTLAVAWILLGLCIHYLVMGATGWWAKYYYVWDKGKDVLLVLCILFPARAPRAVLWLLLVFLSIRLLWEALAIPNYKLASSTEVIDILFAIDAAIIMSIILVGLIKPLWRKQK